MTVCAISQLQEYFKASLPHSGVSDSLDPVSTLMLYFPKIIVAAAIEHFNLFGVLFCSG